MKKIGLIFILCTLMLVACRQKEHSVILPAALFAEMSDEEILNLKEDQGYKDVIINEDHTVTLIMTEDKYVEIVEDLKVDIDRSIAEVIANDETDSIKDIMYNNDYSVFTVTTDIATFDESFGVFTELSILIHAYYYHFFVGNSDSEIKVDFAYVDVASAETFKIETYPKMK